MKTAFDAAYPPATVPAGATCACIYGGGDTPNPIADPRSVPVYASVRWWLPVWVRSNPTPAQGATDAQAMLAWLARNGAPKGTATVLDLETAVTPAYVNDYGGAMHAAGYKVLPYGSRSTLFANPKLDGYFVADPGAVGMYPGSVATQYAYDGAYDLSWITDAVPLWDANPPQASPTPAPAPSTATLTSVTVNTQTGNGWALTTIPWARFLAVTMQGSDPAVNGRYWSGTAAAQERTGCVLVSVTGATPSGPRTVFVALTP